MDKKSVGKPYDFTKDYKKLPIKNRARIIRTARNLLKQQGEDRQGLANDPSPSTGERKGLE